MDRVLAPRMRTSTRRAGDARLCPWEMAFLPEPPARRLMMPTVDPATGAVGMRHRSPSGDVAMYSFLAIALGAALGAWARWGLSVWLNPNHAQVPLGTLAANLIGGYAIGVAMGWLAHHPSIAPEWRLFVITGLLGGLTTFSSFSAEAMQLILRLQYGWAFLLIAIHVLGSLLMTGLGLMTVRLARNLAG